MYGMTIGDGHVGDFHEWPEAWSRFDSKRMGESKTMARPKRAAKPAVPAAPASTEPGPLLRRYLAGEHEAVWAEMVALGGRVHEAPFAEDAWAVARETMRRARHNVELLVRRLDELGYGFWNGKQGRPGPQPLKMLFGGKEIELPSIDALVEEISGKDYSHLPNQDILEQMRQRMMAMRNLIDARTIEATSVAKKAEISDHLQDRSVFCPPDKDELALIRQMEKKGVFLPLSLRAWMEEVGGVNLAGAHPGLCFWEDENFPNVYADPLMVFPDIGELEAWYEELAEVGADEEEAPAGEEHEPLESVIGWNAQAKARLAVENEQLDYGYTVRLPDAAADVRLEGESHNTTFVNYLRLAFRWGGFPGWERHEHRPEKELAFLTEGLLPI
jgi:hypothetical protein